MVQCHCRDCQRATGAGGVSVVIVPPASFTFTRGTPQYYFTESVAMGEHKRGFCPECGSPLTGAENRAGTSGMVGITVASLDDPSGFRPQVHAWVSDAQPWDSFEPGVPKFDQYPTG